MAVISSLPTRSPWAVLCLAASVSNPYLGGSTLQSIATKTAPNAIGPYSQAVRTAGFVFLSGQIALDPATGAMIQGDAAAEAERVMENLGAVLNAAGLTFDHVDRRPPSTL